MEGWRSPVTLIRSRSPSQTTVIFLIHCPTGWVCCSFSSPHWFPASRSLIYSWEGERKIGIEASRNYSSNSALAGICKPPLSRKKEELLTTNITSTNLCDCLMEILIGNTEARSLYWKSWSNNKFRERKKIIEFTHKVSIPEIKETWWGVEEVKISTILFEPESFDTGFDTSTVSVKTGLSWS